MKLSKCEKWVAIITALTLAAALGFLLGSGRTEARVTEMPFAVKSFGEIYEEEAAERGNDGALAARVNINECSKEELEALPGIGTVLAERIIEYRRVNGGFGTIEEITKVRGIGASVFEDIYRLICVE